MDFSSPFNTISRSRILFQLCEDGVEGWLINWLQNYFSNRLQHVRVANEASSSLPNNCGVLQGAVQSPFLFNCYTSSLRSPNEVTLIKYSDDLTVCHAWKTDGDSQLLGQAVTEVLEWSSENGPLLNASKCIYITFSLTAAVDTPEIPSLHNFAPSSKSKFLGVIFNSRLSWSDHVDAVFGKCRRLCFLVRRFRRLGLSSSYIKKFVHACIIHIIVYCSPIIFPGLKCSEFLTLHRIFKIISFF